MVPEKGRNSGAALEHELPDGQYDVSWIQTLINGKGKQAAKTGVGFERLRKQIVRLNQLNNEGNNNTFQLGFKHFGRVKPRPVLKYIELTDRIIEGYPAPEDAFATDASRVYAGFDSIIEDLLAAGQDVSINSGFREAVTTVLQDQGYRLTEELGNKVQWAVMTSGESVPESPSIVLVPESHRRLSELLISSVWGGNTEVQSYDVYSQYQEGDATDEEAILAKAPANVAGIYMYVSGSTAREYGLTVDPIEGAVSRLGVFDQTDTQSMTDITSLKGTYDRLPGEFSSWRAVIDTVESTAQEFGFREINTPSIEQTELYRVKSGDELLDQTYSFEDKAGRDVTLTPEQTPTRARLVQQRKDLTQPIKWFDTSKRWRYENVQKGRDREFFQTDFDIFGIESVTADAEIIACGARIYQKLGVANSVEFLINDRRLLESVLEANGITNTQEVMRVIDDKEKLTHAEFIEALTDRGISAAEAENVDAVTEISGPITDTVTELRDIAPDDEQTTAAIDRMERLADQLEAHSVADMCKLDLSIVRGLAYYTGLVFEAFDTEGELRALFGGGRYDDLVGLFGEQDVPAVGFAFGYSTTRELLQREGAWPEETVSTDVYVAPVSESVQPTATEIANQLRLSGRTVEIDLADRSLGGQFAYADGINARYTVIVGERDLKNDEVTLRDMETGNEHTIPVSNLTEKSLEQSLADFTP